MRKIRIARKMILWLFFWVFSILLLSGDEARAGFLRLSSDTGGDNGPYINIIVREVRVSPVRAHVGDLIRIDMVVENQGDLWNERTPAEVRANGKVVASKLFLDGFGSEGNRIQRITLTWDTRGVKPGEYKIRGEAFVWTDASPFDNFLDVPQPLILLPPGAAFSAGEAEGGTGVGRDPRYKPSAGSAEEVVPASGKAGSY